MVAGKTIGLCVISKDWQTAEAVVKTYSKYFDTVYLQINGSNHKFEELDNLEVSFYKWDNHFSHARNALAKKVETDYWMWVDTDDQIVHPEKVHEIVEDMDKGGVDVVDLAYEYAHNELGECIILQWRERILKNRNDLYWKSRVHETVLADNPVRRVKDDRVFIKHSKTDDETDASAKRNHKLLLQEWKDEHDPRTAHYLGISYMNLDQYEKALPIFRKHVETSGWDEEQYRSLLKMAECYIMLDKPREAIKVLDEGIDLLPDRPDAYFLKGQIYLDEGQHAKSLRMIEDGRNRPMPTETLSPVDETSLTYRPLMTGALALMQLGRVEEAYQWFKAVRKLSPKFKMAKKMKPLFEQAYGEKLAIDKVRWLTDYLSISKGGKPTKVLEALPFALFADPRLNQARTKYIKPKKWPENSIVFLCGETPELWGPEPEYVNRGMGGSEEAILYLSRELTKLGIKVVVYNEREEGYDDDGVLYLPITTFNPDDEFDAICVWRMSEFFAQVDIKARIKMVDLHDTPIGHAEIGDLAAQSTDLFMFKSEYQRQMAPKLPDEKCYIAPNGIVPEQFVGKVKRNPLKVVYGSSHDRGLVTLLQLWPKIKERVPEAELHYYYGWQTYDGFHKNNPKLMKWKLDVIRMAHKAGAIDHGRISHVELAKEYMGAGVWAYPTDFPEISCITAMKAGAAGLYSVTSGFAALGETVLWGFKKYGGDDFSENEPAKQAFVDKMVEVLQNPPSEQERKAKSKLYLDTFKWSKVAELWARAINSK